VSGKDENEKLAYAERCLISGTEVERGAAWEHVSHVLTSTSDPELRDEAQKIADNILRNCDWPAK
jgi:hypothetical protein